MEVQPPEVHVRQDGAGSERHRVRERLPGALVAHAVEERAEVGGEQGGVRLAPAAPERHVHGGVRPTGHRERQRRVRSRLVALRLRELPVERVGALAELLPVIARELVEQLHPAGAPRRGGDRPVRALRTGPCHPTRGERRDALRARPHRSQERALHVLSGLLLPVVARLRLGVGELLARVLLVEQPLDRRGRRLLLGQHRKRLRDHRQRGEHPDQGHPHAVPPFPSATSPRCVRREGPIPSRGFTPCPWRFARRSRARRRPVRSRRAGRRGRLPRRRRTSRTPSPRRR